MVATRNRQIFAAAIGNSLEFYDFAVFAYLAPVMGRLFFPSSDPIASITQAYGVFAVGYLMRPLGGIVFGHYGDRYGRKRALQVSIVIMAVPSTLVGCLPTHDKVGAIATFLLLGLRLLQGLSVGGEGIDSYSFLGEMAENRRRGFLASFGALSATSGYLMGSVVATLLHSVMEPTQLDSWGWRLAFFLAAALGAFGLWVRQGLQESVAFQRVQESGQIKKAPVLSVITSMPTGVLCLLGVIFLPSVQSIIFVWLPTYLSHMVKPPFRHALLINTLCMAASIALYPVGGWLSDRVGRKSIFIVSGVGTLLAAYPLFLWMDQGDTLAPIVSQLVFAVLLGIVWGTLPALMVEVFPTSMRVSGIGLAYNGGMAFVYGTAPWVATWLITAMGGDLAAPAYYIMLMALLSLIAVLGIRVSVGENLE